MQAVARYLRLFAAFARFGLTRELAFRGNFLIKVTVEFLWLGILIIFYRTVFTKTWRVRNAGNCAWDVGYQLAFIEGAQLGDWAVVNVPATAAGANSCPSAFAPGMQKNRELRGTSRASYASSRISTAAPPTTSVGASAAMSRSSCISRTKSSGGS